MQNLSVKERRQAVVTTIRVAVILERRNQQGESTGEVLVEQNDQREWILPHRNATGGKNLVDVANTLIGQVLGKNHDQSMSLLRLIRLGSFTHRQLRKETDVVVFRLIQPPIHHLNILPRDGQWRSVGTILSQPVEYTTKRSLVLAYPELVPQSSLRAAS
jgi:hypothetical protein